MHNIGFVITTFEVDGLLDHDVEFFVRIGERIVRGPLDYVSLAVGSEDLQRIMEEEAEDLYEVVLDRMARRNLVACLELNFLMRRRFSMITLSGLAYPVRSFVSVADLEQWFTEGMDDEPSSTIPAP